MKGIVPDSLLLELEGRAHSEGISAERYLRRLLNNAPKAKEARTGRQREIERLAKVGKTDKVIAEAVGCSRAYVIQVRNKLGLTPNREVC